MNREELLTHIERVRMEMVDDWNGILADKSISNITLRNIVDVLEQHQNRINQCFSSIEVLLKSETNQPIGKKTI